MILTHRYNNKLANSFGGTPGIRVRQSRGVAGDRVQASVYSYWPTVYFASVLVANLCKYETYTVVSYIGGVSSFILVAETRGYENKSV